MGIRGILFDKDGTLIDFPATWEPVLRALAGEFAKNDSRSAEELLALAGYDPQLKEFTPGSVWAAGHTLDLVRAWAPGTDPRREADLVRWVDDFCASAAPDSAMALTDLQVLFGTLAEAGYLLGVATNDNERSARATMARLGVLDRFALVMGYDSVPDPKPGAGMVRKFCEATGLAPQEVAVVGDNLHDVEMARAAGAGLAIGVLSGNARREHLEDHADHLIDSIVGLPALLLEIRERRQAHVL
ncbi:MAG: HAD family hydrolase [Parvibaculaceae bacterium]